MNSTLSERWARHTLSYSSKTYPWLCWGSAALFLAFYLYFGERIGWDRATFFLPMAMMQAIIAMVWWERGGFRRLLAAKDAEIARLRNTLAAATPPVGHS
jgi:hypothetical protein